MSEDLRRLKSQLRSWTARPPARSPRVARARVLARIEERPWPGGMLAAAAATLAAVVLAAGLLLRGPGPPSGPPAAVAETQPAPGLLVYELESGTKLYLALAATTGREPTPRRNSTTKGNG